MEAENTSTHSESSQNFDSNYSVQGVPSHGEAISRHIIDMRDEDETAEDTYVGQWRLQEYLQSNWECKGVEDANELQPFQKSQRVPTLTPPPRYTRNTRNSQQKGSLPSQFRQKARSNSESKPSDSLLSKENDELIQHASSQSYGILVSSPPRNQSQRDLARIQSSGICAQKCSSTCCLCFYSRTYDPAFSFSPLNARHAPWHIRLAWTLSRLIPYLGPAWIIGLLWIDPSAIHASLRMGTTSGMNAIWVLPFIIAIAWPFYCVTGKLSTVSGRSLPSICHDEFPTLLNFAIWLTAQCAIISGISQQLYGGTIGLSLLLNYDTVFLALCLSISVFILCFFFNRTPVRVWEVIAVIIALTILFFSIWLYSLIPDKQRKTNKHRFEVFGLSEQGWVAYLCLAATIIRPHALYFYSTLALSRFTPRLSEKRISDAVYFSSFDVFIALGVIAFIGNSAIIMLFSSMIHNDPSSKCYNPYSGWGGCSGICIGTAHTHFLSLSDEYAESMKIVWSLLLIFSSVGAILFGIISGQFTMQGFLILRLKRSQWILVTRVFTIFPAMILTIVAFQNEWDSKSFFRWLSLFQLVHVPIFACSLLKFSNSSRIIGPYKNDPSTKLFLILSTALILGLSIALGGVTIQRALSGMKLDWKPFLFCAGLFCVMYFAVIGLIVGRPVHGFTPYIERLNRNLAMSTPLQDGEPHNMRSTSLNSSSSEKQALYDKAWWSFPVARASFTESLLHPELGMIDTSSGEQLPSIYFDQDVDVNADHLAMRMGGSLNSYDDLDDLIRYNSTEYKSMGSDSKDPLISQAIDGYGYGSTNFQHLVQNPRAMSVSGTPQRMPTQLNGEDSVLLDSSMQGSILSSDTNEFGPVTPL